MKSSKQQLVRTISVELKLWNLFLHQCDCKILTHGVNFCGGNLFFFKLTLVETIFFTEQILPEYPCSTSDNLKFSPQNSVLISEKFALIRTKHVFKLILNGQWELLFDCNALFLNGDIFFLQKSLLKVLSWSSLSSSSSDDEYLALVVFALSKSKRRHKNW